MKLKPAKYWRENKNWSNFIGEVGKVIFATKIEVTSPELQKYLPYCFAVVEVTSGNLKGKRYEFMGTKGADLKKGDKVRFVLRKLSETNKSALINYGIKVVSFAWFLHLFSDLRLIWSIKVFFLMEK